MLVLEVYFGINYYSKEASIKFALKLLIYKVVKVNRIDQKHSLKGTVSRDFFDSGFFS
jgi:hypothetical protein